MMITYIHHRLCRWSTWVMKGNRIHGLGFPGQCAFTRLTPRTPLQRFDVDYNEDAAEMDAAVMALQRDYAELGDLVRMFYCEPGTVKTKASKLGCCRDTLYVRLHQAQSRIMEWLQDVDLDSEKKYFHKVA